MNKNRLRNLGLVVMCFLFALSCKNRNKPSPVEAYHFTKSVGDYQSALIHAHVAYVQDTSNEAWLDTLAHLYTKLGQVEISDNIISRMHPNYQNGEEILRLSAKNSMMKGDINRSVRVYKDIIKFDPSPINLYDLATIEYDAGIFEDAEKTIRRMLEKGGLDTIAVNLTFGRKKPIHQVVPIEAAGYNVLGRIELMRLDTLDAIAHYKKALEIFPDFEFAKRNLEQVTN
jgi:tetratricopeptide (TPR) repeat protein